MWRTSHENMKHQFSLHKRIITGGSVLARECPQEWIAELVWLNFMSCVMYVGFICYLCVQSKLRINTRSLFNQALKSAHRSLFSFRCWPWGVFSSWQASRALGIARFSYLARVRPMVWIHQHTKFQALAPSVLQKTLKLTRFTKFFGLCDLEIWHMTLEIWTPQAVGISNHLITYHGNQWWNMLANAGTGGRKDKGCNGYACCS